MVSSINAINQEKEIMTLKKHNTLNLSQRFELLKWCEANKDSDNKYEDLAKIATDDLGFLVTFSVLENHWIAVNGLRNKRKPQQLELIDLVNRLQQEVADLKARLA